MPRLSRAGLTVLVVCLIAVAANLWAARAFPDRWGGPNIGGGFLLLVSLAGALTGLILLVAGYLGRR